jgi:hypothetical protein
VADDTDAALAERHSVSLGAVQVLRDALRHGGGRQAQFSHPELGGMGQWSSGGMIQIGDMFNAALKSRVDALCRDLAAEASRSPPPPEPPATAWWPQNLGQPSAAGAQNGMRYACFPEARRVAVEQAGRVTLYDSGEHRIGGVSQSQSGTQDLVFTSQLGSIRAADLPVAE